MLSARIVRSDAPTEWDVDPAKVCMIGFSAGAFLVVDIAVDPRAAPLAFVAAIYGGETLGRPIPKDAPPVFTCIAQDDVLLYRVVGGLYSDWTDAGRSAELHIYRRGNHGFGIAQQGMPSDRWIDPRLARRSGIRVARQAPWQAARFRISKRI
jgi:acetyl esterase/lipase